LFELKHHQLKKYRKQTVIKISILNGSTFLHLSCFFSWYFYNLVSLETPGILLSFWFILFPAVRASYLFMDFWAIPTLLFSLSSIKILPLPPVYFTVRKINSWISNLLVLVINVPLSIQIWKRAFWMKSFCPNLLGS
jgi:hypothetical protein